MPRLNEDVLFLILEELQNDGKSMCSCLLVNKTWCEIVVRILWKNPWESSRKSLRKSSGKKSQLDVILSHLSSEAKEILNDQSNYLSQQKPSFNYIGFCRHLNIDELEKIVSIMNFKESKISILRNEIFNLFMNGNTKFTHLSIQSKINYQIKVGTCFSGLKFLQISTNTNQNILKELARTSDSIKELKLVISEIVNNSEITNNTVPSNHSEIILLIMAQKNLNNISFICHTKIKDESFCEQLEESLIKHADTIQYLSLGWKPITKCLSHFVNLTGLELSSAHRESWSQLENLSLPGLKILKVQSVPSKVLTCLIKNTKGFLTEISIYLQPYNDTDNKKLIQEIYQSSLNLKYLLVKAVRSINNIIPELEVLLINCLHLNGLVVIIGRYKFNWDDLFEILTKSSPTSLFKFKFYSYFDGKPQLKSLKLFFNNWKGKRPMLLQTFQFDVPSNPDEYNLINEYKTNGIIKKYEYSHFEDFDWKFEAH